MDALSIYTTYIALNALCPVSIPDDIRQQIEGTNNMHNDNMIGMNHYNYSTHTMPCIHYLTL